MNKSLFNFLQISRGLLRLQPLGCLEPVSHCYCNGCEPGWYFKCDRCGKLQPYCKGCDDDQFDSCDECWVNPGDSGVAV